MSILDRLKDNVEGSLEISTSGVKGLKIKGKKIDAMTSRPLDEGVIVNGGIEDYLAVTNELKALVKTLGLRKKGVVLALPMQDFFIKVISIARVDEKTKMSVIENELEEIVPNFDPDTFITNYISLGIEQSGGVEFGDQEMIMAITIEEDKVKNIINVLESLNVIPLKIVPDFISLFNFVQRERMKKMIEMEESIMIVDIGEHVTKIFIERAGIFKMQRIVAIGSAHFTETIQRVYNVDRNEALQIQGKLEFLPDEEHEHESLEEREAFNEVGTLIDDLLNQLRVSITFYKSQERVPGVDKVYVTGGLSNLKGLKQLVNDDLEVEVETFSYTDYLSKKLGQRQIANINIERYATLIGNIIEEVSMG